MISKSISTESLSIKENLFESISTRGLLDSISNCSLKLITPEGLEDIFKESLSISRVLMI